MCGSPLCTRHTSVWKYPPPICWEFSGIQSSHSCCYALGLVLSHHIHDPIWKKTSVLPTDQSDDCTSHLILIHSVHVYVNQRSWHTSVLVCFRFKGVFDFIKLQKFPIVTNALSTIGKHLPGLYRGSEQQSAQDPFHCRPASNTD